MHFEKFAPQSSQPACMMHQCQFILQVNCRPGSCRDISKEMFYLHCLLLSGPSYFAGVNLDVQGVCQAQAAGKILATSVWDQDQ